MVEVKLFREAVYPLITYDPHKGYEYDKKAHDVIVTTIRIFFKTDYLGLEVDVDFILPPKSLDDHGSVVGKELFVTIRSLTINNYGNFFTDSHGLAMIERKYNSTIEFDI